jgi:hypothetical protein
LAVSGRVYFSNDSSGLLQTLGDTDILVVDTEIADTEAAEHWGLILSSGPAGIAAGILALFNPLKLQMSLTSLP